MAKAIRKSAKSSPRGVKHFVDSIYQSDPNWAVFAVMAPIDSVANAVGKLTKAKRCIKNVVIEKAKPVDDVDSSMVPVIAVKASPWTAVLFELMFIEDGLGPMIKHAKKLSSQLKTRVLTFLGEDTSGAVRYDLFEKGKELEHAQFMDGDVFFTFRSTLRKQPKLKEVDTGFVDELFVRENAYLPACYPQSKGKSAWLCVEKDSLDAIERVDLLELDRTSAEDDGDGDDDY